MCGLLCFKSCHITPLLRELHWLLVYYRIEDKILLLMFTVLYDLKLDYLLFIALIIYSAIRTLGLINLSGWN